MLRNRLKGSILTGAALLLVLPAIFTLTANPSKAAGAPDLTGVWLIDHFQPALFPKGTTPPFTAWGQAKFKEADTQVNDPNLACLPHGVPRIMFVPLPMEVFQVPDKVMIYQEAGNQLRQIHLNRDHKKDLDLRTGRTLPSNHARGQHLRIVDHEEIAGLKKIGQLVDAAMGE